MRVSIHSQDFKRRDRFNIIACCLAVSGLLHGCVDSKNASSIVTVSKISSYFVRFLGIDSCKGNDRDLADSLETKLESCRFKEDQVVSEQVYKRCLADSFKQFGRIESPDCREKYVSILRLNSLDTVKHASSSQFRELKKAVAAVGAEQIRNSESNSGTNPTLERTWKNVSETCFDKVYEYINSWIIAARPSLYRNSASALIFPKLQDSEHRLNANVAFSADLSAIGAFLWAEVSEILQLLEENEHFTITSNDTQGGSRARKSKMSSFAFLLGTLTDMNERAHLRNLDPEFASILLDREYFEIFPRIKFFADILDFGQQQLPVNQRLESAHRPNELALGLEILALLDRSLLTESQENAVAKIRELENLAGVLPSWPAYLASVWKLLGDANQAKMLFVEPQRATNEYFSSYPVDDVHIAARSYVEWLQVFSSLTHRYRNTGFFIGEWTPILHQGLTQANIDAAVARLSQLDNSFSQLKDRYRSARIEAIQSARTNNEHTMQVLRLKTELKNKMEDLINDRAILKANQDRLRLTREAGYRSTIDNLFNSDNWKVKEARSAVHAVPITANISGADAPRDVESRSLEQLAVPNQNLSSISAGEGDILTFHITDRYQPTCAISKSQYANQVSGSGIGPEGYILQISDGQSRVVSRSEYQSTREYRSVSNSSSDTNTAESHERLEAGLTVDLGVLSLFSSVKPSVTASVGRSTSRSHTESQTVTTGSEGSSGTNNQTSDNRESRTSASFDMGIRLPGTPFPHLPAGALLLIGVPNDPALRRSKMEIRVLSPQTTIVVERPSKYYLVVNDCKSENPQTRHLTLSFEHLLNRTEQSKKVVQSMIAAAKVIEDGSERILATHSLQGTTIQALTTMAEAVVMVDGHHLQADHSILGSLFRSWIANEIDQLQIKIQIQQLEQKMAQSLRNINQLGDDLQLLTQNQGLAALAHRWSTEEFDFNRSRETIEAALYQLRNQIIPVLRIRFPKTYDNFTRRGLSLFSGISFHSDQLKIIKRFGEIISSLKTERENEHTGGDQVYLAINFLKIREDSGRPILSPQSIVTPFAHFRLSAQPFRVLADVMSRVGDSSQNPEQCWDDLVEGRKCETVGRNTLAYFKVTPKDLYAVNARRSGRNFASGALDCQQLYPLVRRMGIYIQLRESSVDRNSINDLNRQMKKVQVKLVSNAHFNGVGDEFEYGVNRDWAATKAAVLFGDNNLGIAEFNQFQEPRLGETDWGLSPFAEFQVDLSALDFHSQPLSLIGNEIENIQLVFQTSVIHTEHSHAKVCNSGHQ